MSLLDLPSNLFRNICSHLSGQDTLRLQCTCRYMNQQLTAYSDALFTVHLKQDFPEGERILDAYQLRQSSIGDTPPEYKKKLYMAFLHRFKNDFTPGEGYLPNVCEWTLPRGNITAEDLDSLVFIVRFWNGPDSCAAVLQWRFDDRETGVLNFDSQCPNYTDHYTSRQFDTRFLQKRISRRFYDPEEQECEEDRLRREENWNKFKTLCRFTLHAVDLRTFRVMSIVDDFHFEPSLHCVNKMCD